MEEALFITSYVNAMEAPSAEDAIQERPRELLFYQNQLINPNLRPRRIRPEDDWCCSTPPSNCDAEERRRGYCRVTRREQGEAEKEQAQPKYHQDQQRNRDPNSVLTDQKPPCTFKSVGAAFRSEACKGFSPRPTDGIPSIFSIGSFLAVPDTGQRSEPGQGRHNAGNRPVKRPDGPSHFNVAFGQMIENLQKQKDRRQRKENKRRSPAKDRSPTRFLFLVAHFEASGCGRRPATLGTNSEPAGPKISKGIAGSGTIETAAGSGVNATPAS
jgi:hypothetical protein